MSEKTPVERAAEVMADRCGEDWDPTHEDDARDMLTAAVEDREGLAETIWEASRADEGTISAVGAQKVADAVARWLTGGGV